jgi:hypothetical protein
MGLDGRSLRRLESSRRRSGLQATWKWLDSSGPIKPRLSRLITPLIQASLEARFSSGLIQGVLAECLMAALIQALLACLTTALIQARLCNVAYIDVLHALSDKPMHIGI